MTMAKNRKNKTAVIIKSRLKKDPGIPRLPNLKVRVDAHEKHRAPPLPLRNPTDQDTFMASEPTLSSLANLVSSASASHSSTTTPSSDHPAIQTKEQARGHYIRALHKVIDQSDVVILVLDARDPEGCRSRLVEEEVRRREMEGKKLLFVLNKIDLVPSANVRAWIRYLKHTTPTLPFRSDTSEQRTNLSSKIAPLLLRHIKAYKPTTQSITVGVVGYPNVGKSSLINSLKRSKVCAVAAQPGHTKELQSVQLERGIRIVDSPGVIFDEDIDDKGINSRGSVLLRNVIRVEDIEDPIAVVEDILARTDALMIQKIYNLPSFASTLEFLTMFSLKAGRLLKGGTPDILASARKVITDWNHQKIPYFSIPPAVHPSSIPSTVPSSSVPAMYATSSALENTSAGQTMIAPGAEKVGHAAILDTFSEPFELKGLFGGADIGSSAGINSGEIEEDEVMVDRDAEDEDMWWDAEEEMDEDRSRKRARSPSEATASEYIITPHPSKRRRRLKESSEHGKESPHAQIAGRGPLGRTVLKRERKRARKAVRRAGRTKGGGGAMDVDDWEGLGGVFELDE